MKIDVTQTLKELDGKTPVEFAGLRCEACNQTVEAQAATLRLVCTSALVGQFRDEQGNLKEDEHVKRYALAMKIYNEDKPDLGSDDAVLIKRLVAKMRGPLIVAQVCQVLSFKESK